ncbi:hypothetical protein DOX71_05670 [Cronobacter sakazakii]|nr:hypothetical protein [Cronobacter sakazakii]EGT5692419.1 hypothetical protein [Cronobacter sakazakii]EGT5718429.1 hypothetical protein [Cronobacter sakazakii]EGT5721831.1 hypothetical protein [Cronobacter sakazakii]PPY49814.1 hypothetical protein C3D79_10330 [Cronobacter sakazakii]
MQRQAMGVALHIVLLPFLNYCIAQLIRTMPTCLSRLFLPAFYPLHSGAPAPRFSLLLRIFYA